MALLEDPEAQGHAGRAAARLGRARWSAVALEGGRWPRVPRARPPDDPATAWPFSLQIFLWVSLHPANPAVTVPRPCSVLAGRRACGDPPGSSAQHSSGHGSSWSPGTAIRDPHGGWSHRGSPLHWAPPPSGAPCRPRRVGSAGQSARPLPCLSLAQNQEADWRGQALGRRGLGHDCGGCWGRPIAGRLVGVGHLPVARHVGAGGHHCPPGEAALVFLVIGAGAWGGAVGVRCLGTAEPLSPRGPVCPTCTQEAD